MRWNETSPLPVYRVSHTAVLLHGSVYVGGGREGEEGFYSNRLDVYNIKTNQWSTPPIITPNDSFAMTSLDDKLFIAGGASKHNHVVGQVLYLHDGQWKHYSEMPTARYSATAVGYHLKLIVIGGGTKMDGRWIKLSTIEYMDTITGFWYTCNNLPSPQAYISSVVMNDSLYVLGSKGHDSSPVVFTAPLNALSTCQLHWKSFPDTPWCASAPVVLYNKYLVTVGGRNQSDKRIKINEICAFDPTNCLWVPFANIPAGRSRAAVVTVAENRIICIGGDMKPVADQEYSNITWIGILE